MTKIGDKMWTTSGTIDDHELGVFEPHEPWPVVITAIEYHDGYTDYVASAYRDNEVYDDKVHTFRCSHLYLFEKYENARNAYERDLREHIEYLKYNVSWWEQILDKCLMDKKTQEFWFPNEQNK